MKYLPLLAILLLTSCYTTSKFKLEIDKTLNQNTNYLRYQYGAPNYVLENGDIGTIWVYSETYVRNVPGYIGSYGYYYLYTPPASYEYEKSMRFWISKKRYGDEMAKPRI